MAEDPKVYEDLFSPWARIGTRRVFSGLGLFRDGLCFALIFRGVLYFKADDDSRAAFEAAGGRPFVYGTKKKQVTVSYWTAPDALHDDEAELMRWADLAYAAALRAAMTKTASKRRKAKAS